jgi:hypothetical protein
MPAYSVARLAESDLKSIIRYTMRTWGRAQRQCGTHRVFGIVFNSLRIIRPSVEVAIQFSHACAVLSRASMSCFTCPNQAEY